MAGATGQQHGRDGFNGRAAALESGAHLPGVQRRLHTDLTVLIVAAEDLLLQADRAELVPAVAARILALGFISPSAVHSGAERISVRQIEENLQRWLAGSELQNILDNLPSALAALSECGMLATRRRSGTYSLREHQRHAIQLPLAACLDLLHDELTGIHQLAFPALQASSAWASAAAASTTLAAAQAATGAGKVKQDRRQRAHSAAKTQTRPTDRELCLCAGQIRRELEHLLEYSAAAKAFADNGRQFTAAGRLEAQSAAARFLERVYTARQLLQRTPEDDILNPLPSWARRELTAHDHLLGERVWRRGCLPNLEHTAAVIEHAVEHCRCYPSRRELFRRNAINGAGIAVGITLGGATVLIGAAATHQREVLGTPAEPRFRVRNRAAITIGPSPSALYHKALLACMNPEKREQLTVWAQRLPDIERQARASDPVKRHAAVLDALKCLEVVAATIKLTSEAEAAWMPNSAGLFSRITSKYGDPGRLLERQVRLVTGEDFPDALRSKSPGQHRTPDSLAEYGRVFVSLAAHCGAIFSLVDGGGIAAQWRRFFVNAEIAVRKSAAGYLFAHLLASSIEERDLRNVLGAAWCCAVRVDILTGDEKNIAPAATLAWAALDCYRHPAEAYDQLRSPSFDLGAVAPALAKVEPAAKELRRHWEMLMFIGKRIASANEGQFDYLALPNAFNFRDS